MRSPAITHVIASINEEVGGPAVSCSRLCLSLQALGIDSQLTTIDYERHGPLKAPELGPFPKANKLTEWGRGWSPSLKQTIAKTTSSRGGIIHNHGCWMFPNIYARTIALKYGMPLITSPRGMLEPWAMLHRSKVKQWAWHWYEKQNLSSVSAFHATSESEVQSIRDLGFDQPIYLVPNGVDMPITTPARPDISDPFVLFMSRIHPKKGLSILFRAWKSLEPITKSWQLVIAGPDLDNYWSTLHQEFPWIRDHPKIHCVGSVRGEFKTQLLTHASIFALPTHSENFGQVVAESLGHGTPVLTTDQTPWTSLSSRGCGWVSKADPEIFTDSLKSALETSPNILEKMGQQGKFWMESEFSWKRIAASMAQAYNHMTKMGPAPDFLLTS
ncbi:MAG: glycosyltransferase [Verrucomicrobiota bacterium]